MTMQVPECLEYEGDWYALCSLPLEPYLASWSERPGFYATPTCLDRMYVGHWRIEDNRLFLIGLVAHDREGNAITLQHLFPGTELPIWADWFSGQLRCPIGKRLKTILIGFESVYESDLLFSINEGRVVGIEKRINVASAKMQEEAMDIPAFLRRYPDQGPS
ncbi:hypothetical protein [Dechloromonas sp. ZS-1]|uniref:hypothetical protein n=1 Tax=Dechloromonas sp. ZS-1 TaxID=3138067 RepID=UPI0031FCDAF2